MIVLIGDYSCPVTASSTTSITCTIGSNSGLLPGQSYKVEVQKKNVGNAIQNSVNIYNFIPIISSISPASGSTAGGTEVTVNGDGFDPNTTYLKLAGVFYTNGNNANVTYNQIKFITQSAPSATGLLSITVNGVSSSCKASPNCNYAYTTAGVPTLSQVSPLLVSDSTNITIVGSGFGVVQNQIRVTIGGQSCSVLSLTNTNILCNLPNLDIGAQNVVVNLQGIGNAIQASPLSVTGQAAVKSISPSSGSVYGGTLVTISGNGFSRVDNTIVKIGSASCVVQSVSLSTVTCLTSQAAAGALSVSTK